MHIGITMPTRSRAKKLQRLIDSMNLELRSHHRVTFCLGLDVDDPQREEYVRLIAARESDSIRFHIVNRGPWNGIGGAFNAVCRASVTGDP